MKNSPWRSCIAVIFLAHFPLFLMDGIYWDDWLFDSALRIGWWQEVYAIGFERGIATEPYFFSLFGLFAHPSEAARTTVFFMICAIAALIYRVARSLSDVSQDEALWLSFLTVTIPTFKTWALLCTANYVLSLTIFLAATALALEALKYKACSQRLAIAGSLVLFSLSFFFKALFVFYGAFWILLWLRAFESGPIRTKIFHRPTVLDVVFLLWPIVVYLSQGKLFPTSGDYSGYNQIGIDPSVLLHHLKVFVKHGVLGSFDDIGRLAKIKPYAFAIASAAGAVWAWRLYRRRKDAPNAPSGHMIAFGLIMCFLAVFPYIAVGKSPWRFFVWDSRHAFLLGPALAVVIVGLCRLTVLTRTIALPLLVAWFVAVNSMTYISYQTRWIKDLAVMTHLRNNEDAKRYSVFWIRDLFRPRRGHFSFVGETQYADYEWSIRLWSLWGEERWVGMPWSYRDARATSLLGIDTSARFHRTGLNAQGAQADVLIRNVPEIMGEAELVARYFMRKYFAPQEQLDAWLHRLVTVDVTPTPAK